MRYVNFKFRCFSAYCSRPPSNLKQTFILIQLLEINYGRSLLSDSFLPNASAKLSTLSVDWKHQRCKCTMAYLKDFFTVSLFLFLFIHNIALLQGLVTITTIVGVENPWVKKNPCYPRVEYLPFPCLNCLTFYLAVLLQIMVLI